jgi:Flp pilus assembly protein CpaB
LLGHAELSGAGGIGAATKRAGMRLVVGVVISLAAVLGIVAALARTTKTEMVVGVRDPVSLGQVISQGDLTVKTIGSADGVDSVPAGQLEQMVGKVAHSPLYPGEILPAQAVAPGPTVPAGDVALTLALAPEQAVGGTIAPGDQVAVLSTPTGLATTGSSSSVALPAVTVLSMVSEAATVGENQYLVTVIVPAGEAPALDAAYRGGKIDLALVGG